MQVRVSEERHILVADADQRAGDDLSRVLQRLGYRVSRAADIQDTMIRIRAQYYDIVLLSAQLLDEAEVDMLRRASFNGNTGGVIVIADQPEIDSVLKALRGRAVDYLIKPYGLDDLTGAICRASTEGGGKIAEFLPRQAVAVDPARRVNSDRR